MLAVDGGLPYARSRSSRGTFVSEHHILKSALRTRLSAHGSAVRLLSPDPYYTGELACFNSAAARES